MSTKREQAGKQARLYQTGKGFGFSCELNGSQCRVLNRVVPTILTGALWLLPCKQAAGGRVKERSRETSEGIVLSTTYGRHRCKR